MKLPNSWSASPQTSVTASQADTKPVVANLDMGGEVAGSGICPECKKPMEEVAIGTDPVLVCMADRITLPIKDSDAESDTQ